MTRISPGNVVNMTNLAASSTGMQHEELAMIRCHGRLEKVWVCIVEKAFRPYLRLTHIRHLDLASGLGTLRTTSGASSEAERAAVRNVGDRHARDALAQPLGEVRHAGLLARRMAGHNQRLILA